MRRHLRSLRVTTLLLASVAVPCAAQAQHGAIVASATVIARGLTLRTVTAHADPALLRLRVDGCGAGVISIDARHADGQVTRVSRVQVDASPGCTERDVMLPLLRRDDQGVAFFDVTLSQTNALVSPAFQQFVVAAAATRAGAGSTLIH